MDKDSVAIESSTTIASTCLHEHVHTEVHTQEGMTPNAPKRRKSPRTKAVSQSNISKPEPKIGFSYTNDPHNTPTRHTSACRPEDIPLPNFKTSQTQLSSQSDAILTVSLHRVMVFKQYFHHSILELKLYYMYNNCKSHLHTF